MVVPEPFFSGVVRALLLTGEEKAFRSENLSVVG
jgi:hypothetical protein